MQRHQNILEQSDLDALGKLSGSSATVSIVRSGRFTNGVHFDTGRRPSIAMSVAGEDHGPRFETFRLRATEQDMPDGLEHLCHLSTVSFVDILVCEESTRPATQNEMEGRLGSAPGSVQIRHRPGDAPDGTTTSSFVAVGVLLTDVTATKLAIFADMFPYAMQVLLDGETGELSVEFEIVSLDEYTRRYHPAGKAPG
jgi:hypothetical protein